MKLASLRKCRARQSERTILSSVHKILAPGSVCCLCRPPMSEESPAPAPLLNRSQRIIVGYAITIFALFGTVAAGIFALFFLGQLVGFFSSVLWPLAVAGVMALILRPLIDLVETRLKFHRIWAVVLLYGL